MKCAYSLWTRRSSVWFVRKRKMTVSSQSFLNLKWDKNLEWIFAWNFFLAFCLEGFSVCAGSTIRSRYLHKHLHFSRHEDNREILYSVTHIKYVCKLNTMKKFMKIIEKYCIQLRILNTFAKLLLWKKPCWSKNNFHGAPKIKFLSFLSIIQLMIVEVLYIPGIQNEILF